ncbi:MAG TPA: Maf family protein [Gammaproteobacteria bacterium]|jgi:septum formation protein
MTRDFIYLASASPRREELLRQIGVAFATRPAAIAEERLPREPPADYVQRTARAKAAAVWASAAVQARPRPVLAADTAVVLDDVVFGKPVDAQEALEMLAALSGRSHVVLTAVAVHAEGAAEERLSRSEVRFRATTHAERVAYCATGEPLDKAGAYAIQGRGALFVERLEGSYTGVVGLPLLETAALLGRYGLPSWLTTNRTPQ